MKVLQVLAGAEAGGAEMAYVDTCIALKQAGFDVEAATRPNKIRNPRLIANNIRVHELPFGGALDVYTPWKLKQIIAGFEPKIVQTWMSRAALKTPASSSDPKKYLKVSRLGGYYSIKYFKTTDYFMTATPDIKQYLIREGVNQSRITHINNFAETEMIEIKISRADLNTPEGAVAVLALSRLHESKALDVLIKSVVDLPQIHLWLAGDGPLRGELEALAQDLGIAPRVHFLGWRTDRAALLEACDICVFPSRYEPFGTVFLQAWQAKTPLITSNAQGPSQYVHDGSDGLVFQIDDVEGLKNAFIRMMEDVPLREAMVANGYARYVNEFTREKTVENYLSFYKDILNRENITF